MTNAPTRVEVIEGQRTLVVDTSPPLPPKLDGLLGRMFSVTEHADIRPAGATRACEQLRTHRFATLRAGRYFGPDRVLRDLRVEMCRDCGAACVRDISYDRMSGLPVGRRGPSRRNHVIGWYSGARRNAREYR